MLRFIFLCLFVLGAQALDLRTAFADEHVRPKFTGGPRPNYPMKARAEGLDGWVILDLTLTAEGKVSDAFVMDSCPKGYFEQAALDAAPRWEFSPDLENGVPTVTHYMFNAYFVIEGRTQGISRVSMSLFQNAMKAAAAQDTKAEGEYLGKIRGRFEANQLNISEAARYHAMLVSYQRRTGNYMAAIVASDRALLLSRFLDRKSVIDFTHLERIASYMGLGQNDNAVDYFDEWRKGANIPPSPELVDAIEKLRAAGAGKGQHFGVLSYGQIAGK